MTFRSLDVIRKYGTDIRPRTPPPSHVPASTRIIDAICAIEKEDRQKGQHWMAMLFEMRAWIILTHEARLRAEGRLVEPRPDGA